VSVVGKRSPVCLIMCGRGVHPFSIEQENEQLHSSREGIVRQSQSIAARPMAVLQPCEVVNAHSRHEPFQHTVRQGQSGCRCVRLPTTTQLRVAPRPEDDHRGQDHNSFDFEDLLFWNVEESLQQKMEGRVLSSSHKHRLPSSKVPSSAVHLSGQTHFNSIVCSAAFSQEDTASSRSTQGSGRERSIFKRGFKRLRTIILSRFSTRRDRCEKVS